MKRGSASELRPCLEKSAFQGEEAVLADSEQAGEISARVGRVRSLAFLCLVNLASLNYTVGLGQPNKRDKPNNGLRGLAGFFGILLEAITHDTLLIMPPVV